MSSKRIYSFVLVLTIVMQSILLYAAVGFSADQVKIIDNRDEALITVGNWETKTSGDGAYGEDYMISKGGTASAGLAVDDTGYYKIYLRWPMLATVTNALAVTVTDGENEAFEVLLDQTINGGFWVFAGTYYFAKGGSQRIALAAKDGKELVFDALRVEFSTAVAKKAKAGWYTKGISSTKGAASSVVGKTFSAKSKYLSLPRITSTKKVSKTAHEKKEVKNVEVGDEFIYDNTSSVFSTKGGSWTLESSKEAEGGNYYSDGSIDDNYLQIAMWSPYITVHGIYEVYMRWPGGENRPDSTKVIIKNFNGMDGSQTVDQTKNSGKWNLIGNYEFRAGSENSIILQANSRGFTAADAVKIKLVSTDDLTQLPAPLPQVKPAVNNNPDKYHVVMDDNDQFRITRNGVQYDINGVGFSNYGRDLEKSIQYFKEAGGNIFRTYGDTALYEGILDYAYEHGLEVMAGLWIPKANDFDYNDETKYREYVNRQIRAIDTFKNHPALALWSVNNESEGSDTQGEVYAMIEEVTRYIKKVDPYHPVVTVFAGSGVPKQEKLMTLAPSIDILSINAYRGIANAYPSTVTSGWKGPLIIGEYGPDGTWETSRTSWGAVIEMPNDIKADLYRTRHIDNITSNNKGVGGFAFCLPYAVGYEGTLTWYGFVFHGYRTPIMDEMQYAWTGQYADNVAPRVKSLTVNGKTATDNITILPNSDLTVLIEATDRDNDELTYHFEIREEINTSVTDKYPRLIVKAENPGNKNQITMKSPSVPGQYRLYVYATDGHDNVGVDNIPVYVKQTVSSASQEVNNPTKIKAVLEQASGEFVKAGKVRADVTVDIIENINGILYPAKGSAVLVADKSITHIAAYVAYGSGENLESDVYFDSKSTYIKNESGKFNTGTNSEYYSMLSVYQDIAADSRLIDTMTLDETASEDFIIIKSNGFVRNFYNNALKGLGTVEFHGYSNMTDKHGLEIYVSKDTGKIVRTIANVGYTLSVEEGKYQDITYIYDYDYDTDIILVIPK